MPLSRNLNHLSLISHHPLGFLLRLDVPSLNYNSVSIIIKPTIMTRGGSEGGEKEKGLLSRVVSTDC